VLSERPVIDSILIRAPEVPGNWGLAIGFGMGGPVSSWRKELDRPFYCLRAGLNPAGQLRGVSRLRLVRSEPLRGRY
jgi:hypothetical protein